MQAMSEADKYTFKMLSTRVNIIPVIGKSDTLTVFQREQIKSVFRSDILQTPIYGHINVQDDFTSTPTAAAIKQQSQQMNKMLEILQECVEKDKDEDASGLIDYLHNMPFALIGFEENPKIGRPLNIALNRHIKSKNELGRRYPRDAIECSNQTDCDFSQLKNTLLSSHRDILRIDTFERFYEQYRTGQLLNRKFKKMIKTIIYIHVIIKPFLPFFLFIVITNVEILLVILLLSSLDYLLLLPRFSLLCSSRLSLQLFRSYLFLTLIHLE